ncbi:hypothetical protein MYBA111488_16020 [Mycobacterium basiliense]
MWAAAAALAALTIEPTLVQSDTAAPTSSGVTTTNDIYDHHHFTATHPQLVNIDGRNITQLQQG